MELVKFLTARLDDDAHTAMQAKDNPVCDAELYGHSPRVWAAFHITFDPARVLREVEAKRRIIGEHSEDGPYCVTCTLMSDYPCTTLRLLASMYNSHPDYDKAWHPDA